MTGPGHPPDSTDARESQLSLAQARLRAESEAMRDVFHKLRVQMLAQHAEVIQRLAELDAAWRARRGRRRK